MYAVSAIRDWHWRKLRRLIQLCGPMGWRRALWNAEYSSGRWDGLTVTQGDPVYAVVERHARGGEILDVGCGSGNTANELDQSCFAGYTGVDISDAALNRATARTVESGRQTRPRYIQSDFLKYIPDRPYQIILFRESVYYASIRSMTRMLRRYARYLAPDGVIVARVDLKTKKSGRVAETIGSRFQVVEKNYSVDPPAAILVFR